MQINDPKRPDIPDAETHLGSRMQMAPVMAAEPNAPMNSPKCLYFQWGRAEVWK